MPIKNITVADLALIELLNRGSTEAPRQALAALQAKGYLTAPNRSAKLTAKGRGRARRLKPFEHDIRLLHGAGATGAGGAAIRTVGGCGLLS